MDLKLSDYDGPTGAFIATGKEILPLGSVAGKVALIGGAMQAGIGDPTAAEALQARIDAIITEAKRLEGP